MSGIKDPELPVDPGFSLVSLQFQSIDLAAKHFLIGDALLEATSGEDTEFNLRHIQPTPVFGRVVKLQPLGDTPCFRRREGLVKGRGPVGVQVVQNQPDYRNVGIGLIHQPPHLVGEVLLGAPLRDFHVSPPCFGLAGQEQVAGPFPPVLVILAFWSSRLHRKRRSRIGQQLGGTLVEADYWSLGIIRFGIQVQHILHVGHKVKTHLGNAPLLLLPQLKEVFSSAAVPPRGTATLPLPTPPYGLPAAADSIGRGPRAPGYRPGRSGGPHPSGPAPVSVGLDSVFQRPLQSVLGKAPLQAEYRALRYIQGLGHLGSRPPLVGLQQNAGPSGNPSRTLPSANHMLQLVALLRRQLDPKFLPGHTITLQQHVLPTD